MDNDQNSDRSSVDDKAAKIEQEVRQKYTSSQANSPQLFEEALKELIDVKIECDELQCKLLFMPGHSPLFVGH